MHLVVVRQPAWKLFDNGSGVGPGVHADVVALEGADERLGHAVRLRAADGRRPWDQPDVTGEGAGVASGVAAAVIRKPLDRLGHTVHAAVAMLDGGNHQVMDVLGGDAAGGRHVPHCLPVAAVEREGYAYYRCNDRLNRGGSCSTRPIRREELDGIVVDAIERRVLAPERLRELLAGVLDLSAERHVARQAELRHLRAEKTRTETAMNKLLILVEDEIMSRRAPISTSSAAECGRRGATRWS